MHPGQSQRDVGAGAVMRAAFQGFDDVRQCTSPSLPAVSGTPDGDYGT